MKFLIAGYGSIGRRHLRNLRELGENDILLLRSNHSTLPNDEIDGVTIETSLEAALAHKPDAVIITNPTAMHLDIAIPAAEAGCNILMEKPVSHSLERVEQLTSALERGGGRLLVGFQFRFHPGLCQVKSWLVEGKIGTPYTFRVHWGEYLPDWHPWEDYRQGYAARPDLGGGVVLTLAHPLDYLRWLFGEAESLWAYTGTMGKLEIAVVDNAEIGMKFREGPTGTVHLDYLQRLPAHTLEISGTSGMIRWDNASGNARLYQAENETWDEMRVSEGFDRNWLFLDEMRHFIQVIKETEYPVCTLEDGVWALRLALAAHQSAGSGQKVAF